MCEVNLASKRTNRTTRKMWKIVSAVGKSLFHPYLRAYVGGAFNTRGRVLEYKPGTTVTSPSGPGIMLFPFLRDAKKHGCDRPIYAVSVPKGATLYSGEWRGYKVVCASRVYVYKRQEG